MTWFTETPWPPMFVLSALAIVSGSMWIRGRKPRFLIGTLMCGAGIIATFVAERWIVSDRERIEAAILDMAGAFERRDEDAVLSRISARQDDLRQLVEWGFDTVASVENLHITDVSVGLTSHGSRATSRFRGNGRFHVVGYGDVGHKATRWELTWQREGAEWKIIHIRRLNPITGEEIAQRAARE